jgi:TRAP-type C4-dicarboxylate transport system substrate-binding protein
MNLFSRIALAGGICLSLAATAISARAQTELTVSSWLPPSHPIVRDMVVPWIDQIETATGGSLKIKILPKAVGSPPAHFDIARDGLADITFGVHGYQPGRFVLTSVAEMPFLGDSAEATSVAYWRIYEKYMADKSEHDGVKVLSVFTHGPGVMMSTGDAITKMSDLDGMKIRIGGGIIKELSQAMGVVAILKPATQSYEILSRGIADGVFFPMESLAAFKLEGLVKNMTEVPGGLYNTSFFLVMNPASYDKLTDEQKAAIDAVSGEAFARLAGKAWDAADDNGRKVATDNGIIIQTASDAFVAEIAKAASGVEAAWIEKANAKGVDAQAMLDEFKLIAKDVAKSN